MEDLKIDYPNFKLIAPKAWEDIEEFYKSNFSLFSNSHSLEDLPFDLSIGIYLHYFIDNGIEWDIANTDYQSLPDSLLEVVENYEKVLSHYS